MKTLFWMAVAGLVYLVGVSLFMQGGPGHAFSALVNYGSPYLMMAFVGALPLVFAVCDIVRPGPKFSDGVYYIGPVLSSLISFCWLAVASQGQSLEVVDFFAGIFFLPLTFMPWMRVLPIPFIPWGRTVDHSHPKALVLFGGLWWLASMAAPPLFAHLDLDMSYGGLGAFFTGIGLMFLTVFGWIAGEAFFTSNMAYVWQKGWGRLMARFMVLCAVVGGVVGTFTGGLGTGIGYALIGLGIAAFMSSLNAIGYASGILREENLSLVRGAHVVEE